jgi:hypothetical protein
MLTGQQVPERIQFFLGMRHTSNLLLRIVDGCGYVSSQILESIGETILLWGGFSGSGLVLSVGGDSSIGIETTDDTVGFGQDLTSLFDKWFDGVHQLLLVKLLFWLALGCIDGL